MPELTYPKYVLESLPDPKYARTHGGVYVQAPEEFGGWWWPVYSPMMGRPWESWYAQNAQPDETFPEGFLEIFGKRPTRSDPRFRRISSRALDTMQIEWDQELAGYVRSGLPMLTPEQSSELATSEAILVEWGMGAPMYYMTNLGPMCAFPDCELPGWKRGFWGVLRTPGNVVAQYQVDMFAAGLEPEVKHPWLPMGL